MKEQRGASEGGLGEAPRAISFQTEMDFLFQPHCFYHSEIL